MTQAVQIGSFAQTITRLPMAQHAVYVKSTWGGSDPWLYVPYLRAVSAVERALPGRSEAQFRYEFGNIKPEAYSKVLPIQPRPYRDWYVCIQALPADGAPYALWCGVLPAETLNVHGATPSAILPAFKIAAGDQTFAAYGFDYLLSRRRVLKNVVAKPDPNAQPQDDTVIELIDRAPSFNVRGQMGLRAAGNRSADELQISQKPRGYAFGGEQLWSHRDAIDYLLYWSDDPNATEEPHFNLDGPDDPQHPDEHIDLLAYLDSLPVGGLVQEGRDVWSLINALIDRRRGLSAALRWETDADTGLPSVGGFITVDLFSLTDTEWGFPRNANVDTIVIDEGLDIAQANVQIDSTAVYDEIVVQGAPVVSCFTAASATGDSTVGPTGWRRNYALFEPAWTSAQQAAYDAAGDEERSKATLERVYRMFRLTGTRADQAKPDFDWYTHPLPLQGEIIEQYVLNPTFDGLAHMQNTRAGYWNAFKRILPHLPVSAPADIEAEKPVPAHVRPFAVAVPLTESTDAGGRHPGGPGPYVLLDDPSPPPEEAGAPIVIDYEGYSAQVTPQHSGLEFEVHFKQAAHALGQNHFTGESDKLPAESCPFDFDEMLVTLAVETDVRPSVVVRRTPSSHQTRRVLTITVDECQVWLVAPGTVVGAGDDRNVNRGLRIYDGPNPARDDTPRLRLIAAMAAAVYGRERGALAFTKHGIADMHPLGVFVRAAIRNSVMHAVRSAVTERSWDFGVAPKTTISTGHVELDVRLI